MPDNNTAMQDCNRTSVLIVGAGPAGLSCAIAIKQASPETEVVVIDKAPDLGNHNFSGAVLEPSSIHRLLDAALPDWREKDEAKEILSRTVEKDDVFFLPCSRSSIQLLPLLKLAGIFKLSPGEMRHQGDYIVSISKLSKWLGQIAKDMGVELYFGFAASEVIPAEGSRLAAGVRLVDQGLTKEGEKQPNYAPGELIKADLIVLAEGCDGLVTERFIEQAGLERQAGQMFSVGVKEVIKVSEEQYQLFGDRRVVHALGYPIWTPIIGPGMFGGGLMYSYGENTIAVGMIVGLDWKEYDFNPQDALTHFKNHAFVKPFIEGGKVIEAGAKMIPEGGLFAVPRDTQTNAIGKGNVLILGDSAGFVNMLKIKGMHNALDSGRVAAEAILKTLANPEEAAVAYTELLERSEVMKEMKQAKKYRQTIARFGNLFGLPLSVISKLLPRFELEPDYQAMRRVHYRFKGNREFDKDTFTAMAHTEHREDQPTHLHIRDPRICAEQCVEKFKAPCITFCPAGVYEEIQGVLKAANASNCLHCKTCQRKCPFDNIRWTVPEGGGGPRYKQG
jgi:electron-transferring-flavoprotein dehydrogenase